MQHPVAHLFALGFDDSLKIFFFNDILKNVLSRGTPGYCKWHPGWEPLAYHMTRACVNVLQQWVVTSKCNNCSELTGLSAMLANNFSTSTCFAIFELIKFMCFGSTFGCPHKEFPIVLPPCMHSSTGSCTCPANAGTCNLRGLTRSVQDSSTIRLT